MKKMQLGDFVNGLKEMQRQIEDIKAGLHDPAFRPARRTADGERLKMERKELKHLKVNQQAKERRLKKASSADGEKVAKTNSEKRVQALENKTPAQRAKEIFKARKQKKEQEKIDRPLAKAFSPPDLSAKVPVKIGNMTVYASPGYNLEELKNKYANRHNTPSRDNRLHNQGKNQAMRDFDK